MTNKIDTVLKAITDQITGALPRDIVKNPKLNVNSTSPVLSARSYLTVDPQYSSHPYNSINAVKKCSDETNHLQKDQPQPVTEIRTQQPEESKQTLEDEFKDLHLNLPVLEVLTHAQMLGNSEPFDTLASLGACVNIIPLYLFKNLNIGLLEETDHVFRLVDGTKSYPIEIVRDVEIHIRRLKLLTNFYVIDMKKDPETPLLVGRGFLATANAVIDYRKAKIAIGEGITRKKRVTFVEPCETSTHNTPAQVEHQKINSTNAPGIPSTGVKGASAACRSKPRSNTKKDRTLPAKSALKQVEAHSRMNKSNEKQKNHVDSSISYKRTVINSNSNTSCKTCNKCLISVNHDQCVVRSEMFGKQSPATKVWRVKQVWKATGKLFTTIGHQWRPTGRLLPLGDQWPLTRNTPPTVLPTKQWKPTGRLLPLGRQCPLVRSTALKSDCMPADPQETIAPVVQIVLWYLDSGCSKHMTGDRLRLRNFVKKFIGTVRFGNDHFGAFMGYGDYVIGDSVISRVHYVEGLGHSLFFVGQFCDSDLEVAFRKHTCFVRDLDGVDLIKGSRGTNLYTISVEDMMRSSPICLLSKASKNKSCPGSAPNLLTPGPISSGLVPNPPPAAPYVPPTNKELEILFQPMFDEYFESSTVDRLVPPAPAAQALVNPTGPSVSIPLIQVHPRESLPSSSDHQSSSVHQGVAAEHSFEVNPFAAADPEPFVNVFAPDHNSKASSSGVIARTESNQTTQPHEHLRKWTASHPIDNIIGNPSRPVSTQKQLATDALWFPLQFSTVQSRTENSKSAITEDCGSSHSR
ncbi:retrovirus-related pol polyprotein from transposon TNT 1-94 [Tanacetum coccineum]